MAEPLGSYVSEPGLQDVVSHGTAAEVRGCVRAKDKDWRGQGGQSLLFWAAKRQGGAAETLEICRFLLETIHLEVDLRSAEERPYVGRSALFLAALYAPPQVTAYFLERRADPNREDRARQTPLFFAVSSGCLEALELLLSRGADANHQDQNGQTPLFYAAKAPQSDLAAALIRHIETAGGTAAAAVSVQDTIMQQTPLFYAAKFGAAETCGLLIEKHCNADSVDKNGQSALFWAAKEGRADFVQLLLEMRATADLTDTASETALFYAADFNRVDACRVLLERGQANPLHSAKGRSPAEMVFKNGANRPRELVELFQGYVDPASVAVGPVRAARRQNSNPVTPTSKRRKAARVEPQPEDEIPFPASLISAPAISAASPRAAAGSATASANDGLLGDLPRALLRGTPADVRRLVETGHDPKTASSQCGASVFSLAVMRPDKDDAAAEGVCRVLVEECGLLPRCGPSELSMAASAKPAFLHSVQHGLVRCAAYLLQVRCDVQCKNEIGQTPLFIAAGLETPDCLAMLLDASEDPNTMDPFGRTPLFEALVRGHANTVEALIQRGASVDLSDREGKHTLDVAAPSCVLALVRARCDPNLPRHGGFTPLCVASRHGNMGKVQTLLEARANAALRDEQSGRTALHVAVESRQLQVCRLLMEHDADPNVEDAAGATAISRVRELRWSVSHFEQLCRQRQARVERAQQLQLEAKQQLLQGITAQGTAQEVRDLLKDLSPSDLRDVQEEIGAKILHDVASRHPTQGDPLEICRLLIEEVHLNPCSWNEKRQTPLFSAAWVGNVDLCNYLIQKRCNVDDADNYGRTALFCASNTGQRTVVRTLLQLQAEVDRRDTFLKQTALFFAAGKSAECVSLLLTAKAEAGALDKNEQTALFYSSREGVDSAVRMLVHARADVNRLDNSGRPALFFAIRERKAATAAVLLDECNAWPPEDRSSGPFNLLEMAHARGLAGIVEKLTAKGLIRESLLTAAKEGSVEDVDAAIEQGVGVGASNFAGWTALHCAVARRDAAGLLCARRLLEAHGANVNAVDKEQQTPLFIAAREGARECVVFILENRGDVRHADRHGETALFQAARRCRPDVVSLLLERGAVVNRKSASGRNAAFAAASAGSARVLELLLDAGTSAGFVKDMDNDGRTALFGTQDSECVQLLLDRQCEVDACDRCQRTALYEAEGHSATRLLLAARASIEHRDQQQQTPLFPAAARSDATAARLLLEARADSNAIDAAGQSALFAAAARASLEVARLLVCEGGANPGIKDAKGQTAVQVAKRAKPPPKVGVLEFLGKAMRVQPMASQKPEPEKPRVRYRLAFPDPGDPTGALMLAFGTPQYEEALLQFAKDNIWLKPDLWISEGQLPLSATAAEEMPAVPHPPSPVHV